MKTTSLPLSKAIAEAATKAEYVLPLSNKTWNFIEADIKEAESWLTDKPIKDGHIYHYRSFSIEELLEILPPVTLNNKYNGEFGDYVASVNLSKTTGRSEQANSPAESLGKLFLYLITNGHLK